MDFELFFDKIGFAEIGREDFRRIHSRIIDPSFARNFLQSLEAYDKGDEAFAAHLEVFAAQENLPVEILNMYIYLRKCEQALAQFRAKGISDQVFYDSAASFTVCGQWLLDHEGIYGISRSPHRKWMRHFFNIEIFRLGRLEFEYMRSGYDAEIDGHALRKGDPCVGVHIPAGKLNAAECEEAYDLARDFFRKHFDMENIIFYCVSWLLHPWLGEDLSPDSGIVDFQKRFKIIDLHETPESIKQMLQWAFLLPCENVNDYPEDTSLRRALKKRLLENRPLGEASGIRL